VKFVSIPSPDKVIRSQDIDIQSHDHVYWILY